LLRSVPADEDASLAAALLAREPAAAKIAWTRYSPLVLRLLRRYFGPGPERQDLCQEVFLRFFSRIAELREPAALRNFLIGICLGVAQNEVRRARVRRWIFLTQTGDLPDAPIQGADPEAREATARVYQMLAALSPEDRTLFVARYVEKMELGEIATAVGRPLSTTKRRVARVTRRVAARMSRDPALADYVEGLLSSKRDTKA
jgi:RNA polymerase sigma-70 factor (ECF subfamily)